MVRDVAEGLFLTEPVTLAVLLFVLSARRWSAWFSRQPVRKAGRQVRRAGGRDSSTPYPRAEVRATQDALTGWLKTRTGPAAPVDVAAVAHTICADGETAPYDTVRFRVLMELCRHALEPATPGLVVRYLVSGAWEEHREALALLARYLDQFENLRPVLVPRPDPEGVTFAEAVSALTGAVVAVDLTGRAARSAERVVVWQTQEWTGRPPARDSPGATPYLQVLHEDTAPVPVGSYNGRVPTLVRAEVRQGPGSDGAALVLTTAESDYASTEPRSTTPGVETPYQCKKLLPATADVHLRALGAGPGGRTAQLNVKVGLVSYHDGSPHLVLMRRTDWVSNAPGVIAPTSGGVVELEVPGDRRDGDGLGAVAVLAAARRELAEELGLGAGDYSLAAHAVFLANNRTRPLVDRASGAVVRPATGELTTTVLAIGTTNLGPSDFVRARTYGSPGTGLFESHGVLFVPMGDSAEALATNLTHGGFARDGGWLAPGVDWPEGARRLYDWIEQPTLVTALYASALVHRGPDETVAAFERAAEGRPWWALPWPDAQPGGQARICRDPRLLVRDADSFGRWCDRLHIDDWQVLLEPLEADAAYWSERFLDPEATGSAAQS